MIADHVGISVADLGAMSRWYQDVLDATEEYNFERGPDLRGLVPRHPKVKVQGFDREGAPFHYVATGFEARIIQHEYDHLNGVVFLDRMRDFKTLAYFDEWESYLVGRSQQNLDDTAVG